MKRSNPVLRPARASRDATRRARRACLAVVAACTVGCAIDPASDGLDQSSAMVGTGMGLRGEYYDHRDLSGPVIVRNDPDVDYDWGNGAPVHGVGVDTFGVRWTGRIEPRFTETYTFATSSDDGVRLWIDGREIIDNWTDHATTSNSGTIALVAGHRYDLRMEYYENEGQAVAKLSWQSTHQAREIVPSTVLYLPGTPATDAGTDAHVDSGTDARTDSGTDARTDSGADAAVDASRPPVTAVACPPGFTREVFRDDFDGTALDTSRWQVIQGHSGSGGDFTQLTNMRAENVRVTGGQLHLSSERHCSDPYTNRSAPENPATCPGGNFYSGAWIKTTSAYAGGHGAMAFLAQMPDTVPGIFPALWGRNTEGGSLYGEFDLIEMWWDVQHKGTQAAAGLFSTTTIFDGTAYHKTTSNLEGPFANLSNGFHVWEVEWNTTVSPATVTYYYRDTPGGARTLLRTVTSASTGLSGVVSEGTFEGALNQPWRAYIDFAVQPDTVWHIGPDTASLYDPADLVVDSVVLCQP